VIFKVLIVLILGFTHIGCANISSSKSRAPSSMSFNDTCHSLMLSFMNRRTPVVDVLDELLSLKNINETLFENMKLDILNDLKEGKNNNIFITPLEKIAYMEAYVEFHSKYPLTISMADIHKKLTSKNRKKLAKLLNGADFDQKWTKRKYRKFIFKYYALTRDAKERPRLFTNFSEEVQRFILRRAEQQILMDHFVKRGPIVSKIRARIKLSISLVFNIMMLRKVGAFYSFYELKLFSPSDEIIDKIYKNGLLSVKEELISQYKLRSGIEVTYNELRPYMIAAGITGVAASNYQAYSDDPEYFKKMKTEYKEMIVKGVGKVFFLLEDDVRSELIKYMEEKYLKELEVKDASVPIDPVDVEFLRDTLLKE